MNHCTEKLLHHYRIYPKANFGNLQLYGKIFGLLPPADVRGKNFGQEIFDKGIAFNNLFFNFFCAVEL